MRPSATTIPCLALLAACTSAPRPPDVDENRKRPANSATAVSLQVCKNDLHNTRLAASETLLREETARAGMDRLSLQNQLLAMAVRNTPQADAALPSNPDTTAQPKPETARTAAPATVAANTIYTVNFAYASTQVTLPEAVAAQIVAHAKTAPLVLLRGRTDASQDNLADSRIARNRAMAVRDYLVAAGVDPRRIRSTHQPAGDHMANNGDAAGRASNRRVEIELYHATPLLVATASRPLPHSPKPQP